MMRFVIRLYPESHHRADLMESLTKALQNRIHPVEVDISTLGRIMGVIIVISQTTMTSLASTQRKTTREQPKVLTMMKLREIGRIEGDNKSNIKEINKKLIRSMKALRKITSQIISATTEIRVNTQVVMAKITRNISKKRLSSTRGTRSFMMTSKIPNFTKKILTALSPNSLKKRPKERICMRNGRKIGKHPSHRRSMGSIPQANTVRFIMLTG
mmetsp:Transcript_22586/g.22424  ORF Transcript_22586/g.22424 Transcript_22586/m.22424 type:complete len:214 (+) Transcript_22586:208-849(+)